MRDESTLISCGAEGAVKVWDVSGPSGGGSLKLSWGWHGVENPDEMQENPDAPGATSVEAIKTDLKKVAVAYQNAIVKIFDIETGKELSRLESDMSYGKLSYVCDLSHVFIILVSRWYTCNPNQPNSLASYHVHSRHSSRR